MRYNHQTIGSAKKKENEFFPRKVEEKSQRKYDALYFSKSLLRYLFVGIWLSHQIGIFLCANIRNTNNRRGVNNLY